MIVIHLSTFIDCLITLFLILDAAGRTHIFCQIDGWKPNGIPRFRYNEFKNIAQWKYSLPTLTHLPDYLNLSMGIFLYLAIWRLWKM